MDMEQHLDYAEAVERAVLDLIRQQMKREHVTAREIDRRVGLSHHRLSKRLRDNANITVAELELVCMAMDLDPARLVRTAEASVEPIDVLPTAQQPGFILSRVTLEQSESADIPPPQKADQHG